MEIRHCMLEYGEDKLLASRPGVGYRNPCINSSIGAAFRTCVTWWPVNPENPYPSSGESALPTQGFFTKPWRVLLIGFEDSHDTRMCHSSSPGALGMMLSKH